MRRCLRREGDPLLNVGVIGPSYPDSFADNIADGLEDLGHRGTVISSRRVSSGAKGSRALGALVLRSPRATARVQAVPIVRAAKGASFDACIVVDSSVAPDTVAALGSIVRPLCFWYPDPVVNLGRQSMLQAPYDAVFTKEPRLAASARDIAGIPMHYLPEACNPRWHRIPEARSEQEPHLAVIGNYYPYRIRLLERLVDARVPLRLYGNPIPRWMPSPKLSRFHTGRYVARAEKAAACREATAVLNALNPAEMEGMNTRLFEATASGGCVLSEERSSLADHYTVGEEVMAFSTFDELVDQARWCIDHPDAARQIGDLASKRAHAEHTFAHRLAALMATVGLEGASPGAG